MLTHVSLTPAQVNILANTEPFRSAMARAVQAVSAWGPQIERLGQTFAAWQQAEREAALRHRIRTQYRRKSRGHR